MVEESAQENGKAEGAVNRQSTNPFLPSGLRADHLDVPYITP